MPIYEYQCRQCGERSEALQRLADPPLSECEECGGELKKLISAPAFQFKGTGWYVTDYAKKDRKEGDGSSEDTSSASGDGDDSGSSATKVDGPAKSSGESASGSSGESPAKKESSASASESKAKKSSAS